LLTTCASGQVLQWNGSTWACSAAGTGTITGVTAGTDLTGGGTSGKVTLNLDTTKVPQLATSNTFSADQSIAGNLTATGAITGQTINGFYGIFTGSTAYNQPLVEVINSDGNGIYVGSTGGDAFAAITNDGGWRDRGIRYLLRHSGYLGHRHRNIWANIWERGRCGGHGN
jgi:hypothetical protein